MNVVGTKDSKNVVCLQELVPQHDCLKLLILHTPYTLKIDTLNLCVNLVKLDLSKNNLQTFPHLGGLYSLKFMFIHENRLDFAALKGIFQQQGKKSVLSENIVWVTFWGNRNAFIGRHYLANQTSAIAVDKNMVVQQEKTPNFRFISAEPFSYQTDISYFFEAKGSANRFASEEEYMRELWVQMGRLRKLHEQLCPVIKIQKVFRGWLVREGARRQIRKRYQHNQILNEYFKAWLQLSSRQAKLKRILHAKKKQYLLLDLRQMRKQEFINKMLDIAREVKHNMFTRKNSLQKQFRFYNMVRQNYLLLKNLYYSIGVAHSTAVYIHKNQWEYFMDSIMPFLKKVNQEPAIPLANQHYCLHLLYQFYSASKQFIKVMQTNSKSIAYFTFTNQNKKVRRPYLYGSTLKPVYGKVHIPTLKKFQLKDMMEKIQARRVIALGELVKFEGSQKLLKDIVRGVYLFNTGRLSGGNPDNQRIHVFTECTLKKIASVIKIQKVWRGYSYRKKNQGHIKTLLKFQRAAIIIQRWVRRLPVYKKKNFIYNTSKQLEGIKESRFYIQTAEYLSFLKQKQMIQQAFPFAQLQTRLYLHSESSALSLCWDHQSQCLQTVINLHMKKWPFSRPFLKNKVGLTDEQIDVKVIHDPTKHIPSTYSHIFHYGTASSMVTKGKKTYLEVTCSNRNQAKFRVFVLLVCGYSLHRKNRLSIFDSKYFREKQLSARKEIGKEQANFICNQNFQLIKLCETRFQNESNVKLHIITNRFYFQGNEKPLKAEEKLFIYTANSIQPQDQVPSVENLKRYRTEQAKTRAGEFRLLVDQIAQSQAVHKESQASKNVAILIKKRSVKQYKIDKKSRQQNNKKNHPNFLLDSMSINERLTTQPDVLMTQMSNQENSAFEQNNDPSTLDKYQQKEQLKIKQRLTYIEKRNNSFKRKEDESFTKRFVNLGNFIQNQYANDYRRRIKTELQCRAADSAQHVRRDIERSQSQKIQQNQEKHKKIREKHTQHKQLIEKTQSLMRDHSLQIKNGVIQTREKKIKQKAKLKRLKVSFAEQCYPLASRHRKQQYFP